MADLAEFERYMDHLCGLLGHADRRVAFLDYSRGLMLPIERKSVEPLAAHTDPWHVSSKHQSLHHLVAKADWSDEAVLGGVRAWASPALKLEQECYWKAAGVPVGVVLADAGYGTSIDFREGVSELGLKYCVGVLPQTTVWTAERAPLPPKRKKSKLGRLRDTAAPCGRP